MSNQRETNVADFVGECNAGILIQQIAIALSDAAMAQINHGTGSKKANVALTFSFTRMGDNDQVIVSHKLSTSNPTKSGKKSEENLTETAFFVGKGGQLTIKPPVEDESGQYHLENETENVRRLKHN